MYTLCSSTKYQILDPLVGLSLSCHLSKVLPFLKIGALVFLNGYESGVRCSGDVVRNSQAATRFVSWVARRSIQLFESLVDSKKIVNSFFLVGLGTIFLFSNSFSSDEEQSKEFPVVQGVHRTNLRPLLLRCLSRNLVQLMHGVFGG